ncbi:hypothetical protein NLJ89_g11133 [Agrocybe chaxingu]|uniref:Uncharacterized protein n=1 Tax=Agrocybe chaxingu TaxID=84603 RepID=A0A9W8JPB2_9AGAR|nr:hypothetical protein NLJ89_g11133 [Agrocybe chaxingu]
MHPPPPPYSTPTSAPRKSFSSLPAHILLKIIADVFPTESDTAHLLRPGANPYDPRLYEPTNPEEQRKVLFWLSTSLRLVNRQLYAACMYILRSTYLQAYQSLIRPPYTSDPFPLSDPSSSSSSNTNGHDPTSSPTPPATAQR